MSIAAKIKRWWDRRQYRAYLVDSIHRSTDGDQIRRLHDRLRDFDAGGDGKYQPPSTATPEPPLDCGACPGDGTVCTTSCRLMEDSPHPEGCTYPRCVIYGSCKTRCDLVVSSGNAGVNPSVAQRMDSDYDLGGESGLLGNVNASGVNTPDGEQR
jgi:hypothetical protein